MTSAQYAGKALSDNRLRIVGRVTQAFLDGLPRFHTMSTMQACGAARSRSAAVEIHEGIPVLHSLRKPAHRGFSDLQIPGNTSDAITDPHPH